ncbi:hypothetical protein JQX13_50410 [Archangium violaceum]|uniref:hypothetical protein n=1 Tax=Archangium violaceum TaxID=83451 RepID=UPI00193C515F|nr:hypothetical protein [Archangium violaceum]QRK08081.1 hypothetical protein JQX13_50410 [Archangium violaceum]
MALVTLNGVEVECTDSEWEPVRLGEVVRSINGIPRSTQLISTKRNFRFTTGPLPEGEAEALRALIDGEGHVLTFEDNSSSTSHLYTSREVPPSFVGAGVARSTAARRKGFAGLTVPANQLVVWNLGFSLYVAGTFIGWVREGTGLWRHVINTAGRLYIDGVANSDEWLFGYISGDSLFIGDIDGQGVATAYDDVVALPFEVPESWVPGLHYFHSLFAWPGPSQVYAWGPRFPPNGLLCVGQAGTAKAGPRLTSISERFDFTLYGT